MAEEENFDSRAEAGGYLVVLKTADGSELGRSQIFDSEDQADETIESIVEDAATQEDYKVTITSTTTTTELTPVQLSGSEFATLEERYDFNQLSQSGQVGFEPFRSTGNNQFYFHFNDANGVAILYSWAFVSKSRRDKRIGSVIKNASKSQRYERLEKNGRYYFILQARNGQEIARSPLFDAKAEMEGAITLLQDQAPSYAEEFIKPKKRRSQQASNQYNLFRPSTTGQVGFDTFRAKDDKKHYVHFNDAQGKALLYSQAYTSSKGRDNGIRSLIKNAGNESRYVSKEEDGRYYFVILAGNRQEIARSCYFESKAAMQEAMAFLQVRVPSYATAYGVQIDTKTITEEESLTLSIDRPDEKVEEQTDLAPDRSIEEKALDESLETHSAPVSTEPIPTTGTYASTASSRDIKSAANESSVNLKLWYGLLALLTLFVLLFYARSCSEQRIASRQDTQSSTSAVAENSDNSGATPDDELGTGSGNLNTPQVIADASKQEIPPITAQTNPSNESGVDTPGRERIDPLALADAPTRNESHLGEMKAGGASLDAKGKETSGMVKTAPRVAAMSKQPVSPTALITDVAALEFPAGTMETEMAGFLNNSNADVSGSFTMDRLRYSHNSHTINPEGKAQIKNLAQLLKANPNVHIKIHGHIGGGEDEVYGGPDPYGNLTLSQLRADCVYRRLTFLGIPRSRLEFEGFSDSKPVSNNNTKEGQQENRRVEIVVTQR